MAFDNHYCKPLINVTERLGAGVFLIGFLTRLGQEPRYFHYRSNAPTNSFWRPAGILRHIDRDGRDPIRTEDAMFKVFSLAIAATVLSLGASRLHAQQRAATLQKVEIPGIGFDLVVALAKPS